MYPVGRFPPGGGSILFPPQSQTAPSPCACPCLGPCYPDLLHVGTGSTNAPRHFQGAGGKLQAFDIDIARMIAQGGLEPMQVFYNTAWRRCGTARKSRRKLKCFRLMQPIEPNSTQRMLNKLSASPVMAIED